MLSILYASPNFLIRDALGIPCYFLLGVQVSRLEHLVCVFCFHKHLLYAFCYLFEYNLHGIYRSILLSQRVNIDMQILYFFSVEFCCVFPYHVIVIQWNFVYAKFISTDEILMASGYMNFSSTPYLNHRRALIHL